MYKYPGWKNIQTTQSREILTELIESKEEQRASMIISKTGDGKTTAINLFKSKKPRHTYVVTLGDTYNLLNVLNELQTMLSLPIYTGKNAKHISLRDISNKINELADEGQQVVIIFDEAENARINVLKALKELYDAVTPRCGIVLIGTQQLIAALNKTSEGQSIPQLRRRFKAGTRFITPFNKVKDMKPFFETYIPNHPDLQDLLIQICDNYGELHDYLHPFLVHCEKKNIDPTEANFRLYHKLPKR